MDLISGKSAPPAVTLRSAALDWLSGRQESGNSGAAEVAVAAALERDVHSQKICARLHRGVAEQGVRHAFAQCHKEIAETLATPVELVIEQHPIRRTLADEYCEITTNEPAEHSYVFNLALHGVSEGNGVSDSQEADSALVAQLTEIAVAFPAARDGLEELLWQHRK
ncbi:MAG: hypothetical protein Q4E11_05055 [Corynebacterium sp.]|uniref:hypothetical protein n=1 Tax=Corynebacterium sp. TaxID=1720 RepID=UPI0026DB9971|nr:hypothetical protein [Corynebacterium sp.]MDO5029936.1 hypothetical protein [Corynebacterium sp.]